MCKILNLPIISELTPVKDIFFYHSGGRKKALFGILADPPRGQRPSVRPRPSVHMKNSRPTVKQKSWRNIDGIFWRITPRTLDKRLAWPPRTDPHHVPPPLVTWLSCGGLGQEMESSVCTHPDHPRPSASHLSSPCRHHCRQPPSDLRSGGTRKTARRRRHPALRSERQPEVIPRFVSLFPMI